jgi:hypothetical protein
MALNKEESRQSRRKGCPLRGSPFGEEVPTGGCAMLREVHQLEDSAGIVKKAG